MSKTSNMIEDTTTNAIENTMPKRKSMMTRSQMRASRSSAATAMISPVIKSASNPEERVVDATKGTETKVTSTEVADKNDADGQTVVAEQTAETVSQELVAIEASPEVPKTDDAAATTTEAKPATTEAEPAPTTETIEVVQEPAPEVPVQAAVDQNEAQPAEPAP